MSDVFWDLALPSAFRILGKWDERAKMPMSHATISFHEYLRVIHGARVSALAPCASAVGFELYTRLKHHEVWGSSMTYV